MNVTTLVLALIFAAAIFAFSRLRHRPSDKTQPIRSNYPQFEGLFAHQREAEAKLFKEEEEKVRAVEDRERLLHRAAEGDEKSLDDAHGSGDCDLYYAVLRTLVDGAGGNTDRLRSIAGYIVDSGGLRSSSDFSQAMIKVWASSLDARSMIDMLYLAALSDDALTFKRAIDAAFESWRNGVPRISAGDFIATVECAYWLIASEVRYSGSGFEIKMAIADLRRKLAATNRRSA